MTQEEYLQFHEAICGMARSLSQRKNTDYAAPTRKSTPYAVFANFMQCETLGITGVEQGFLVRLSDKFSRLCNLLEPSHVQQVKDESVDDTIQDIINYVILLAAYRETKRLQNLPAHTPVNDPTEGDF
jgi:hypothetical protein